MFLENNACWRPDVGHRTLSVVSGHLWATRPGSADLVFGPGDTADLRGRGWVLQVLGEPGCEFSEGSPADAQPGVAPMKVRRRRSFFRREGVEFCAAKLRAQGTPAP